jgi:hypothetical protein
MNHQNKILIYYFIHQPYSFPEQKNSTVFHRMTDYKTSTLKFYAKSVDKVTKNIYSNI